jgi:hypothetical protein
MVPTRRRNSVEGIKLMSAIFVEIFTIIDPNSKPRTLDAQLATLL